MGTHRVVVGFLRIHVRQDFFLNFLIVAKDIIRIG
jgi:hypothetical protein